MRMKSGVYAVTNTIIQSLAEHKRDPLFIDGIKWIVHLNSIPISDAGQIKAQQVISMFKRLDDYAKPDELLNEIQKKIEELFDD